MTARQLLDHASKQVISIGEACHVLGVSRATLRKWVNEGRVRAFLTPGGHRRFRVADLLRIVGESDDSPGQGAEQPLSLAVREGEQDAVRRAINEPWYRRFSAADLGEHRSRGQDLIRLFETYLSERDCREGLLQELERQAGTYGRNAAAAGLSLRDLMAAFNIFRRPVVSAIGKRQEDDREQALEALTDFFDVFTAIMVESYLEEAVGLMTRGRPGRNKA